MGTPLEGFRSSFFSYMRLQEIGFTHLRCITRWHDGVWNLFVVPSWFLQTTDSNTSITSSNYFRISIPDRDPDFLGNEEDPFHIANRIASSGLINIYSDFRTNIKYINWCRYLVVHMATHKSSLPTISFNGKEFLAWMNYFSDDMTARIRPLEAFAPPPPLSEDERKYRTHYNIPDVATELVHEGYRWFGVGSSGSNLPKRDFLEEWFEDTWAGREPR